jgi:hypothetical protein
MAASLKEFGDPIGDRQLVLTLLHGLNEKYRHMVSNLKMQRPFPTFPEARTLLLLEEIDVNDVHGNTPSASNTQALLAAKPPPPRPTAPTGPGGFGGAPSGGGRNRCCGRSGNGGNNGGGRTNGAKPGAQAAGQTTWPVLPSGPNPWSGMVQLWPYGFAGIPNAMPRPQFGAFDQPQPALHMASYHGGYYQQMLPPGYGSVAPGGSGASSSGASSIGGTPSYAAWNPMAGGSFDQASLINNFNTMTLTPPPNTTEWYADSGAGSHMTDAAAEHHRVVC